MLEQRFNISVVNEATSFSIELSVRSRQLFRSVQILIASQLRKSGIAENPKFICFFNNRKLNEDDVLEDVGIIEGSVMILHLLNDNNSEEDINSLIQSMSVDDVIDQELAPVYNLIDSNKLIEAFELLRSNLFSMSHIPVVVERLRLRFASIPYNPNIFVIVHELFFIAYSSNQSREVLLSLLLWYKVVVPKILSSQKKVSVQTMLLVIHSFLDDLQIVSLAISILVSILKDCDKNEAQEIYPLLSEESVFTDFYTCIEQWNDMKLHDMILFVFSILFAEDNVLLKNLNENRVFLEFNQILEKSSSITMVCQLMDIILILLKCSKFILALESSRILFSFRYHLDTKENGVYIVKRFCSFLVSILSKTSVNLEKIKRQILFLDVYPLFLETATQATYDVQFLSDILVLSKQLCCNNEFCIYLSNNGLLDFIQTCLTLRFDNENVFLLAFGCYSEIILNSWICRERVLSPSTIEVLFILVNKESCSIAVIVAFCELLLLVNDYESGKYSLQSSCSIEYLQHLREQCREIESIETLVEKLINGISNSSSKVQSSNDAIIRIVPKINRSARGIEIKRREGSRRSNHSIKQLSLQRAVSEDSSCEIDSLVNKQTSQKTLSDGSDIYSVILTELDYLPILSYAKQLVHCMYYLLEPGLFSEIITCLDVSLIPAVLARIAEKYIDDEEICLYVSTIISTISQKGCVDYLIKGDVMELLVKLLNKYCQNYLITGYSLYSLYQLAQRDDCINRLAGAGVVKSLQWLVENTHDIYIRGYAVKTLQVLGEEVSPSPNRIDVEEGLMVSLLSLLDDHCDNPKEIIQYLDLFVMVFRTEYPELHQSFFVHKGILQLEELIKRYASNSEVVSKITDVFTFMAKHSHSSQELEKSDVTAIAIHILLRYPNDKTMIKNALNIIRCVCTYSSTASTLIHYIPQLQSLLLRYPKSISICECIIHIFVLMSQIGEQTRLSILQSNILDNIDTVVFLHTSRSSLLENIFTLFYELSESPYGCECLVNSRCYEICLKVIQHVKKAKMIEKEEIISKAVSVIERTIEKGKTGVDPFLITYGIPILMDSFETMSVSVKRDILCCMTLLLQSENEDESFESYDYLSWLLSPSHVSLDSSLVRYMWSCCHSFIRFHSSLITTDHIQLIINQMNLDCREYLKKESIITVIIDTLLSLVSSSVFKENNQSFIPSISSIVFSVNTSYTKNEIIQYQLSCIESILTDDLKEVTVPVIEANKTQDLLQSLNQALRNPTLQYEDKDRLLDLLLEICNNRDLVKCLSMSPVLTTLGEMFTKEYDNDRQNQKILAIFGSVNGLSDSLLLQLLEALAARFECSMEFSDEYFIQVCMLIEIACNSETCCTFVLSSCLFEKVLDVDCHSEVVLNTELAILLELTLSCIWENFLDFFLEALSGLELCMKQPSSLFIIRCQLIHSILHFDETPSEEFSVSFIKYLEDQVSELDVMEACSLCQVVMQCDYRGLLEDPRCLDWLTSELKAFPNDETIVYSIATILCSIVEKGSIVNPLVLADLLANPLCKYTVGVLRSLILLLMDRDVQISPACIIGIVNGVKVLELTSTTCLLALTLYYNLLKRADVTLYNTICELLFNTIQQFSSDDPVLHFFRLLVEDGDRPQSLEIVIDRYSCIFSTRMLTDCSGHTLDQIATILRKLLANEITAMLLMENGIENAVVNALVKAEESPHDCMDLGWILMDLSDYEKPRERMIKNELLQKQLVRVEKKYESNNELSELYSHIILVLKEGGRSVSSIQSDKERFVELYGPIPSRPPPPLPLGCK